MRGKDGSMITLFLRLVGLVLIASLALAACGGGPTGGEEDESPTATVTDSGEEDEAEEPTEEAEDEAEEPTEEPTEEPEEAEDEEAEDEAEPADMSGVTLEIGVDGEQLLFDKDTMEATVAEGADLTIQFNNTSKTQEHNFILLNTDDMSEAEAFNQAATAAGSDLYYYPEDNEEMRDLVIGDTYIHNAAEESGTMTVPAPPPGDYIYVCTIPGHFVAGMHGVLTINAP